MDERRIGCDFCKEDALCKQNKMWLCYECWKVKIQNDELQSKRQSFRAKNGTRFRGAFGDEIQARY